jgi:hypothetical protein
MFRKLLLASVTALGLLSPMAVPAVAGAHEYQRDYRYEHHHRPVYRVYYRYPFGPGWFFAGAARGHAAAERLAEGYRLQGFAVSIRG